MMQLIGILLTTAVVASFVISFFIPRFWTDSDESPLEGLSPKLKKVTLILYLVLFVLIGATFYLGTRYDQLQSASVAAAYPTPVIHISAHDVDDITNNFNDMCSNLTLGEWQAVFDDFTPAYQSQVGTISRVPYMIGGAFKGGYDQAAYCRPDDSECGNQVSGAFANIVTSPDANHAQFCGDVNPPVTNATVDIYNVCSFSYVRTNAGWKVAAIQTLAQYGN